MSFRAMALGLIAVLGTASCVRADEVLFQSEQGAAIPAGRFGAVAAIQVGLARAAKTCGLDVGDAAAFADGVIGQGTRAAVQRVAACAAFPQSFHPAAKAKGAVTRDLWVAVAPATPPPDYPQRAYILTVANEDTDYTDVEFNVGSSDPGILTWGPLGATAADAEVVQRILRAIDAQLPGVLDRAFASEAGAVRTLSILHAPAAKVLVAAVMAKPERRATWRAGFAALGADARVRALYDGTLFTHGVSGIPEAIEDFFRSYWRYCKRPTEADYGLFFDRVTHMAVFQALTDTALDRVAAAETRLGVVFSPAERRRAIAANFIGANASMVGDRLARDVAYYIDALPPAELTDRTLLALRPPDMAAPAALAGEVALWKARSGRRASQAGLTDSRPAGPPAGLTPPACAR